MHHILQERREAMDFSVRGARAAATAGQLEAWVHAFLTNAGPGANVPMAIGLRKQRRWWIGPIAIPLGSLVRICGPEPDMEYRTTPDAWEAKVSAIAAAATDPESLPPLILMFHEAGLMLCDGNHRHEALRRRGYAHGWALIWSNSEPEHQSAQAVFT
jgi:hypothetical protein